MAVKTYDPGQHYCSIAGIRISGFAEGTYIEVDRIDDAFKSTVGSQGEVARVRSRDKRGTVKITLMATSPCNDLLSRLFDQDEAAGTGQGIFSLTDGNGTTVASAQAIWGKKRAGAKMSKDMPTRDWEFECADLSLFVGGNS